MNIPRTLKQVLQSNPFKRTRARSLSPANVASQNFFVYPVSVCDKTKCPLFRDASVQNCMVIDDSDSGTEVTEDPPTMLSTSRSIGTLIEIKHSKYMGGKSVSKQNMRKYDGDVDSVVSSGATAISVSECSCDDDFIPKETPSVRFAAKNDERQRNAEEEMDSPAELGEQPDYFSEPFQFNQQPYYGTQTSPVSLTTRPAQYSPQFSFASEQQSEFSNRDGLTGYGAGAICDCGASCCRAQSQPPAICPMRMMNHCVGCCIGSTRKENVSCLCTSYRMPTKTSGTNPDPIVPQSVGRGSSRASLHLESHGTSPEIVPVQSNFTCTTCKEKKKIVIKNPCVGTETGNSQDKDVQSCIADNKMTQCQHSFGDLTDTGSSPSGDTFRDTVCNCCKRNVAPRRNVVMCQGCGGQYQGCYCCCFPPCGGQYVMVSKCTTDALKKTVHQLESLERTEVYR